MMEGHPEDDDIEGWYLAASCCDENRVANIAFHSASRSTPSIRSSSFPTRFPTMPTCQMITNPVPSSMPTSSAPTPMDVDATKCGGVCTLFVIIVAKWDISIKIAPKVLMYIL